MLVECFVIMFVVKFLCNLFLFMSLVDVMVLRNWIYDFIMGFVKYVMFWSLLLFCCLMFLRIELYFGFFSCFRGLLIVFGWMLFFNWLFIDW